MGTWQSRGLRGNDLEMLINMTNEKYRENGLALVEKIPTPIKAVKLNAEKGNISEAYFEKRSSVDYIGVIQGVPVCFDAKEIAKNYFPLKNIHAHQLEFMNDFEKQGGLAFVILHMTHLDKVYFLPTELLNTCTKQATSGGRKSIPLEVLQQQIQIPMQPPYFIHYLSGVSTYLHP